MFNKHHAIGIFRLNEMDFQVASYRNLQDRKRISSVKHSIIGSCRNAF